MAVIVATTQLANAFNRSRAKKLRVTLAHLHDFVSVIHEAIKIDARPVCSADAAKRQRQVRASNRRGRNIHQPVVNKGRYGHDMQDDFAAGIERNGRLPCANLDEAVVAKIPYPLRRRPRKDEA